MEHDFALLERLVHSLFARLTELRVQTTAVSAHKTKYTVILYASLYIRIYFFQSLYVCTPSIDGRTREQGHRSKNVSLSHRARIRNRSKTRERCATTPLAGSTTRVRKCRVYNKTRESGVGRFFSRQHFEKGAGMREARTSCVTQSVRVHTRS